MSHTTLLAVYPGEKTEALAKFSNSHHSAPLVWEFMAGKYLGVTKAYDYPQPGWMQLEDELWDLWKRPDIPKAHRAVFMLTFDRCYVIQADFPRMVSAIEQFLRDLLPQPYGNHWPVIAYNFKTQKVPALGLWCTSVSENPFSGDWDENDVPLPFDWTTAYDLFSTLDAVP